MGVSENSEGGTYFNPGWGQAQLSPAKITVSLPCHLPATVTHTPDLEITKATGRRNLSRSCTTANYFLMLRSLLWRGQTAFALKFSSNQAKFVKCNTLKTKSKIWRLRKTLKNEAFQWRLFLTVSHRLLEIKCAFIHLNDYRYWQATLVIKKDYQNVFFNKRFLFEVKGFRNVNCNTCTVLLWHIL